MKPVQKETRIAVRATREDKELLAKAAEIERIPLSEFVLDASRERAQAVLADQNRFVLPDERMREFCEALDAAPREIPQLRRLFSEPSVFER